MAAPPSSSWPDADLHALCVALVGQTRQKGWRLAVAESCTGGRVGGAISAVAGCSDVFVGGVIAYANPVKRDLLGVDPVELERHGAVSEQTARAMARGVCARLDAELGLAVTGVAGPGGGTALKPVGLIWLACQDPHTCRVERLDLAGDREAIRLQSVYALVRLAMG